MTSRFCSLLMVVALVGGGMYQVLVSWFLVPRGACDLQLFVYSVVLPTDPSPCSHGDANISETGGRTAQKRYFQAVRTPCLCK